MPNSLCGLTMPQLEIPAFVGDLLFSNLQNSSFCLLERTPTRGEIRLKHPLYGVRIAEREYNLDIYMAWIAFFVPAIASKNLCTEKGVRLQVWAVDLCSLKFLLEELVSRIRHTFRPGEPPLYQTKNVTARPQRHDYFGMHRALLDPSPQPADNEYRLLNCKLQIGERFDVLRRNIGYRNTRDGALDRQPNFISAVAQIRAHGLGIPAWEKEQRAKLPHLLITVFSDNPQFAESTVKSLLLRMFAMDYRQPNCPHECKHRTHRLHPACSKFAAPRQAYQGIHQHYNDWTETQELSNVRKFKADVEFPISHRSIQVSGSRWSLKAPRQYVQRGAA